MIFDSGNSNLLVGAASATVSGDWLNIAKSDFFSVTLRATASAATLAATFKLQGTDFGTKSGSEATLINFTLASVLATNVTYAAGVVTFASPLAATYEVVLVALGCPRFVRGVWTYTSGGGTVAADAALSCW
jgi:hypothetical protein